MHLCYLLPHSCSSLIQALECDVFPMFWCSYPPCLSPPVQDSRVWPAAAAALLLLSCSVFSATLLANLTETCSDNMPFVNKWPPQAKPSALSYSNDCSALEAELLGVWPPASFHNFCINAVWLFTGMTPSQQKMDLNNRFDDPLIIIISINKCGPRRETCDSDLSDLVLCFWTWLAAHKPQPHTLSHMTDKIKGCVMNVYSVNYCKTTVWNDWSIILNDGGERVWEDRSYSYSLPFKHQSFFTPNQGTYKLSFPSWLCLCVFYSFYSYC